MKVRDLLRQLERDGWEIVRQKGSHRQLKNPDKPGTVTLAGHPAVGFAEWLSVELPFAEAISA